MTRARAARPARGPVDPGAEAVAFADEAEALACLLEDRARGRAAARWWWQAFRSDAPAISGESASGADLGAAVAALLSRRPAIAVATLATLADRGSVAQVVAPLAPQAALRLIQAIGAPLPAPAPTGSVALAAPSAARPTPWAGVSGPAAWLVAAALALRERPGAPPESLVHRIIGILRTAAEPQPGLPPEPAPATLPGRSDPPGAAARTGDEAAPEAARATRPAGSFAAQREQEAPARSRPAVKGDAPPRSPQDARARDAAAPDEPVGMACVADGVVAQRAPLDAAGEGVATALAGAFFLINLLERPDLAAPLPEPVEAGSWALLDLLARALAGSAGAAEDALWRLLAALDGRAADAAPEPALWPGLDVALPHLRTRLGAAMQLPADAVAAALLRLPGRVFATPVHLDLLIPLAELRLPVRRAGLDLDPGWSPRFGRIIAFHYQG